jgi:hypothetical protein
VLRPGNDWDKEIGILEFWETANDPRTKNRRWGESAEDICSVKVFAQKVYLL